MKLSQRAGRFAAAATLAAFTAGAQQPLDYGKSRIAFTTRQMNVPVDGEFKRFSAELRWDAARPEASTAAIAIEVASFDMGEQSLNDEARSRPFFDARAHPQARFVSTGVRALAPGRHEVSGKLTIKGVTREVVVPFTLRTQGAANVFDGAVTIRRRDFNVGEGEWADTRTLADEVQVKFRIVAAAKA